MTINNAIQDASFVAKTLVNNMDADAYEQVDNIADLIEIFQLFKADKITSVLVQNGITSYLKDSSFDYKKYFDENTISKDKITAAIAKVVLENKAIANEIKEGNPGKAGILVGKVIAIIGKGASGKLIRTGILEQLSGNEMPENKQVGNNQGVEAKSQQSLLNRQAPIADNEQRTAIIIKEEYRTHKISELSEKLIAEKVTLSGWVASVRDHGELLFIDLRDASNQIFQVRLSRESFPNLDELVKLKPESVIAVTGRIVQRNEDDYNAGLRTGKLELETTDLEILNLSKTLPFEIKRAFKSNEKVRFEYKFLDHRNTEVRSAIVNRHKVIKLLRDILDEAEFLEIETPILTAG
ncbi:MAG TPA: Asp-tRNA(Asn)/Glu-tRNA(Gln) amidotransferase GatCAB subunit B, partial [Polaribacter sp.]|nr:Asp-tRNA(Asn)/Glu-tRNA(Gln) amidotransferase GatCAB subunit B [Polaribacter sp.]